MILDIDFSSPNNLLVLIIFMILILASSVFFIWKRIRPNALVDQMIKTTQSWWVMCFVFLFAILSNTVITILAIALLSFVALRELVSALNINIDYRSSVFLCYLSIFFQYFFIYKGWFIEAIIFLPLFILVILPCSMIISTCRKGFLRSYSFLSISVILAVYSISHLAFLITFIHLDNLSSKSLLLFLIFLTQINDIMQFIFGKIFGRNKILPYVSPNKTWEGFLGGLLSTTIIGCFIGFLTPFNYYELIVVSTIIAVLGFLGDSFLSAIKRDVGVKDLGVSISGHGGFFDRIDSLVIISAPFFYIFYFLLEL